jgi:hypothetical protein
MPATPLPERSIGAANERPRSVDSARRITGPAGAVAFAVHRMPMTGAPDRLAIATRGARSPPSAASPGVALTRTGVANERPPSALIAA